VMQATPRGDRKSSAMTRASFVTSVLVFPLPGPASTQQFPADS
jgi:hypothetical protein